MGSECKAREPAQSHGGARSRDGVPARASASRGFTPITQTRERVPRRGKAKNDEVPRRAQSGDNAARPRDDRVRDQLRVHAARRFSHVAAIRGLSPLSCRRFVYPSRACRCPARRRLRARSNARATPQRTDGCTGSQTTRSSVSSGASPAFRRSQSMRLNGVKNWCAHAWTRACVCMRVRARSSCWCVIE